MNRREAIRALAATTALPLVKPPVMPAKPLTLLDVARMNTPVSEALRKTTIISGPKCFYVHHNSAVARAGITVAFGHPVVVSDPIASFSFPQLDPADS